MGVLTYSGYKELKHKRVQPFDSGLCGTSITAAQDEAFKDNNLVALLSLRQNDSGLELSLESEFEQNGNTLESFSHQQQQMIMLVQQVRLRFAFKKWIFLVMSLRFS